MQQEENIQATSQQDDYKSVSEKQGDFYVSQEECLSLETRKYSDEDSDPFEALPFESNDKELPLQEQGQSQEESPQEESAEEYTESGATMSIVPSTGGADPFQSSKPWAFRQLRAYNETRKEWDLFKYYCGCGESRSITHVAQLFGLRPSSVLSVSQKNNWALRSEAYDKFVLAKALRSEEQSRQAEHIRKLELFREQQEFLGAAMTSSAAKIMHLAQRRLDAMLAKDGAMISEAQLSSLMSVATKIAETGKTLTGTALGVDALLEAVESNDGEDYG